ncbi:MAG: hypothetical protein ACPGWR_11140 [Ardenticatenaceae bacterium]
MLFLRLALYILISAVIVVFIWIAARYLLHQIKQYFSQEAQIDRDIQLALTDMNEGRLNNALHLLATHNLQNEIDRCLRESLPQGHIKLLLLAASEQLLQLKHALPLAQQTGVPESVISPLRQETDNALDAVFTSANRFAAVHIQGIEFSKLGPTLEHEIQKLQQIVEVSQQTRETLAKWTILGGGEQALQEAETRLRAFEEATRHLMEFV